MNELPADESPADGHRQLRYDRPHDMPIRRRAWLGGVAASGATALTILGPTANQTGNAAAAGTAAGARPGSQTAWWTWRGPNGNNIAASAEFKQTVLSRENVVWQAPVPGRGHSSPIVTDEAIYLTTADTKAGTQSLLAFNRRNGKLLWNQLVHQGGLPKENHRKNTEASSSAAFDGQRVIATFYNSDALWVSAYSPDGKQLWQKSLGRYYPDRFKYGYAASPMVYKDTAIVIGEFDGPAFMTAVALASGEPVWRIERPNSTSFSSPIVANINGRDQLLVSGQAQVMSYNPDTGDLLWSAPGTAMATCGTAVWDDQNVYASGGFPQSQTVAIRADGSNKIVWQNNQKCYEQSMLCFAGHIYAITDQGVAYCWRASDGEMMWRERLGGNYSSSPVLVGTMIHVFNEACAAFAFEATPKSFVSRGRGKLGDEAFATPAIVGNRMYMRVARNEGTSRQEYLLAIR